MGCKRGVHRLLCHALPALVCLHAAKHAAAAHGAQQQAPCGSAWAAAGFTKVDSANWVEPDGFTPYGTKGIFNAASQVFFAYLGFEMVATAAEEAKNPKRDIPIATVVSVSFCGVLYVLMALVITGMVPYNMVSSRERHPGGGGAAARRQLLACGSPAAGCLDCMARQS
jgi:amino acid transporter